MKPVKVSLLALIVAVATVCGAVVVLGVIRLGGSPFQPTFFLAIFFAVLSGLLLYLGFHIRRLRARKPTWMRPIAAARSAALARATTYVSCSTAGVFFGMAAIMLARMDSDYMRYCGIVALVVGISALVCAVCAGIVERWCVVDTDDDSEASASRMGNYPPKTPS
ncbi:DUF3180 family protein [Schaalia sp. lx-100]|uniref:DUF3180 family protein n=1 Tax=Schaalia sp. lx-100 TaxID=2899081 RepID=UPI001E4145B9|nr:DUF3180 domain-containing protein [Schaalia sp. lx-100]